MSIWQKTIFVVRNCVTNEVFRQIIIIFAKELIYLPIMNAGKIIFFPAMLLAGGSLVACEGAEERPNVLFIYADDLGYGDLECFVENNSINPNISALCESGVRFANAYSVASTSTPSRYSLLTGEYAWRRKGTDVADGDAAMIISPDCLTVADVFKRAGYATGAFGKWHLGLGAVKGKQDWNGFISPSPADLGFDEHYIMAATADRVPCVFIENGKVAGHDSSAPVEVSYVANFDGEPTGKENPELLYNLKSSHGHNMSIVNGIGRIGYMRGGGDALWKDENIADSITARAVDFIRSHGDEPFFLYFAANDVHVPRFPHERFRGKSGMGLRGDAIVQFDWSVGQLVAALEECGILDNTLIILTSDNGPVTDDGYADEAEELLNGHSPTGGLRGGKYSAFEGGARVPLVVSWRGVTERAAVSDKLVSQVDFLPSMAALVGVELGDDLIIDGGNYLDSWLGLEGDARPYVVTQASNHTLSLRTAEWKYIEPKGGPAMVPWGPKIETGYSLVPQLYDMSVEGERDNVAAFYPSVVEELKALLQSEKEKNN